MPYSVFTISWLCLVAMVGAVGLTSAADEAGEKIGDFLKYANGTALDTRTNLMWMTQDFRNLEGRAPKDWDEAMAWALKMNVQRYGGYSDWRVPTDAEYKTLYDPRRSKKSYAQKPVGYPEAFEDGGRVVLDKRVVHDWETSRQRVWLVLEDLCVHTASISAVATFFNADSGTHEPN